MDLVQQSASEALKSALRSAAEGLSIAGKIDLLAGAEWGLKEREGLLGYPGPLPVGPEFLKGRQIALDFPR